MGNSAKRDARTVAALKRDHEALRMREAGKSYEEISQALGYGARGNAYRAVKKRIAELRAQCGETADEVRKLETARLDRMLDGIFAKAEAGDPQAIATVIRIQERRTAYEGLDVPKALHVELNRNVEAVIRTARSVLTNEQFDLLLAALGGEHRPPDAGGEASGEEPGEAEGDDESGGS